MNLGLNDELVSANDVAVQVISLLIIAYASGYEHGHHDTVEGCFSGDGHDEAHDERAREWLDHALYDATFEREVTCFNTCF